MRLGGLGLWTVLASLGVPSAARAEGSGTSTTARAQEEAEMFGGEDSAPAAGGEDAATETGDGDPDRGDPQQGAGEASSEVEAGLGGEDTIGRLTDRLEDSNDILDIGGSFWLRLDYSLLDEGDPEDFSFRSPSFVDLYADARPNDRLRAFVQGRLKHDLTVGPGTRGPMMQTLERTEVALDQLWLKADLFRAVFVTAGRQRVKWGASRFWNPTDFMNQQRLDPLAIFDSRLGVGLLKIHVPWEAEGANFYALGNFDGADPVERLGGALRAELATGQSELSITAAVRKDDPIRLGVDFSTGVWLFDLRGELAVLHRVRDPFWDGKLSAEPFELPTKRDRRNDWIPELVLGADLTVSLGDEDSLTVGAEYFFNDAGYSDEAIYPWLIGQGQFTPLYLGRHYAGAYALLMGPGDWDDTTFLLSTLGNLSDRSFVTRFDYRVTLLTYLSLGAYASLHYGEEGGEFLLSFEIPAVPGFMFELPDGTKIDLSQGFKQVPQRFDVGLSLSIAL